MDSRLFAFSPFSDFQFLACENESKSAECQEVHEVKNMPHDFIPDGEWREH